MYFEEVLANLVLFSMNKSSGQFVINVYNKKWQPSKSPIKLAILIEDILKYIENIAK
jgi:hypothetical protein